VFDPDRAQEEKLVPPSGTTLSTPLRAPPALKRLMAGTIHADFTVLAPAFCSIDWIIC
jgi:hypothetical protein